MVIYGYNVLSTVCERYITKVWVSYCPIRVWVIYLYFDILLDSRLD